MTADFDKRGFGRVVLTLAPYLDEIVFVGGWSQRLFRLHPLAASKAPAPLITLDADLAAPITLSNRGRTLRELLLGDLQGLTRASTSSRHYWIKCRPRKVVPATRRGQRGP